MTDWETIARICRGALACDTSERSAFLDEACAGDVALRREIGSLLEPSPEKADTSDWLIAGLGRLLDELNTTAEHAEIDVDGVSLDQQGRHALFRSSPFSILGVKTLADLLSVMHLREYVPDEYLIRQGDPAEFLLLILGGTATARVRDAPSDRPPVGEFGPGDVVGEISLITDEPRTADVVAQTAVRALHLSVSDFHVMTDRHPDLRVVLTDVMADRLGHARYDGLGGKDIHGYQVIQCVGRGGMGVVYEAKEVATGRKVALKMMNHRLIYQPSAIRRFRREAAILKTLDHPSIARLYAYFSAYKTEFLAMEFCQGPTLAEAIASYAPLSEDLVRRMVGQLAVALKYVHDHGVVHRDLKPSNIVLTRSGSIKLLDFGIVTVDRDSELFRTLQMGSQSHSALMLGTPRYMAPEQFSADTVDRRADFYGLACVAFEALTGRPAIVASDVFAIVREKAHFALPPRDRIGPGVSAEMHDVLLHGLEHDPEKRTLDLDRLAAWAAPLHLDA